jgi:DHA1 family tetracycline resistance protein-like MFS transporter
MPERNSNRTRDRGAFAFLLITAAIDGLGAGIFIPIIPQLLMDITGESVTHAAVYGGWLLALFALVQFFAAPVLGNLSDRYGRRSILLVSMTAVALDYVCYGLAPTIGWLFLADIFAGVFTATLSTATAYIADITRPEDRARRFGMLNAALGIGMALGPVLSGLVEPYGPRTAFFVAAALAFINVSYGLFSLPESLRPENRRVFSFRRSNLLGTFIQMRNSLILPRLMGSLGLMQIAAFTVPIIWGYFTIQRFDWSQSEIGLSLSLYVGATILVQGTLLAPVNRRLGNLRTACVGFSCSIIGLLGYAFAPQGWIMLAFILPSAVGSLTGAALTAYLSNSVSANSQGELQGAIAGTASAAAALNPLLMTWLFNRFAENDGGLYFPGMPFIAAALMAVFGLVLTIQAVRRDVPVTAPAAVRE